jgi:hypothetical protein
MNDNVTNFMAHKAKRAEAKATLAMDNTQALAEQAVAVGRLRTRLTFDRLDQSLGSGKSRPYGRIQADIVETGRLLTECRRIAGGNWETWLKHGDWTDEAAQSYINVYKWYTRCVNEALISGSSTRWNFELADFLDLHLLADPWTPEAAREEVIRSAGKPLTPTRNGSM